MGLTNILNNAAKVAMSVVGDLKSSATAYMIDGDPVYDDDTGVYVTNTLTDVSIEVLLYDFEGREVIEKVNFSTDQVLLLESRLLENATTPNYFDIDGIKWDVVSPLKIPGDAIREYHVRNTGESI